MTGRTVSSDGFIKLNKFQDHLQKKPQSMLKINFNKLYLGYHSIKLNILQPNYLKISNFLFFNLDSPLCAPNLILPTS